MEQPPLDPTTAPENSEPTDSPRLLPTIDPASPVGRMLHDQLSRLRFANVDPAIRRRAQDLLDGRGSLRDLMASPEFQPTLHAASASFATLLTDMSPEERERFREDLRAGRPPGGFPGGAPGGGSGAR